MPNRIPIHKPLGSVTEHARQRVVNSRRTGSSTALGYGRLWQRIRAAVLALHPMCVMCAKVGKRTVANEVDHIDGDSSNNANDNLRALCKPCHSRRTAKDQSFGRKNIKHC